MSPGSFLFFSVVNVVTLCGSHLLFEVGDACLDEDVVPLDELLDVGVLHTVYCDRYQVPVTILFNSLFFVWLFRFYLLLLQNKRTNPN